MSNSFSGDLKMTARFPDFSLNKYVEIFFFSLLLFSLETFVKQNIKYI